MAMKTHDEMVRSWIEDPDFLRAYESLEQEFRLFDELLCVRKEAGLIQAEVAERQVKLNRGLPFDVGVPNAITQRTFAETDVGENLVHCDDAQDMFTRLGA